MVNKKEVKHEKNLISLTILVGIFVLFSGHVTANAEVNPDKLKYKEITAEKFLAKGDIGKLYSAVNGYKITEVSILSIENKSLLEFSHSIHSSNKFSVDITDFSKKWTQLIRHGLKD